MCIVLYRHPIQACAELGGYAFAAVATTVGHMQETKALGSPLELSRHAVAVCCHGVGGARLILRDHSTAVEDTARTY